MRKSIIIALMTTFLSACQTVPYTSETLPEDINHYENPKEKILVSMEFQLRPGKTINPYTQEGMDFSNYLRDNMYKYGTIVGETSNNNALFYVVSFDDKYFFLDKSSVELYKKYKDRFLTSDRWKKFTNSRNDYILRATGAILQKDDMACSRLFNSIELKYQHNIDNYLSIQEIQVDPQSIILVKSKEYQDFLDNYPSNNLNICGEYSSKKKVQLETVGGFMKMFDVYKGKYIFVRNSSYFIRFNMDKDL